MISNKDYRKLLIAYPESEADPFAYAKDDKPYLLFLSNRKQNCTFLYRNEIQKLWDIYPDCPQELHMGYTYLYQYERLFLLEVENTDDTSWSRKQPKCVYYKSGIKEDDYVADSFLFLIKEKDKDVCITTAFPKWCPALIRELTGKSKYSINDAQKIIRYMTSIYREDVVYACIGVKTVSEINWH